jgi:hypothetical protein
LRDCFPPRSADAAEGAAPNRRAKTIRAASRWHRRERASILLMAAFFVGAALTCVVLIAPILWTVAKSALQLG